VRHAVAGGIVCALVVACFGWLMWWDFVGSERYVVVRSEEVTVVEVASMPDWGRHVKYSNGHGVYLFPENTTPVAVGDRYRHELRRYADGRYDGDYVYLGGPPENPK
jgi:hypothetical protein